jgi:hypothetical protein
MKATTWVLLIGLTAGPLPGCKKRPPQAGHTAAQPEVKWPVQPADGAPVALAFVAMAHRDKVFGAELRVFSFSEKAVRGLKMTFHFLDKKGVERSRLAYPNQGQPVVGPKAHVTLNITAPIDHRTDRVTVTLDSVVFMDGSGWTRKNP